MKLLQKNIKSIRLRFYFLLKQPLFWAITVLGHVLIFGSTTLFYYLEKNKNSELGSILDALSWSIGIMTTIGYGTVIPVTTAGKILSLFMMLIGSLFLWSYMALFVSVLLAPDLGHLEKEMVDLETDLSKIRKTIQLDNETAERLIHSINSLNDKLSLQKSHQSKINE